MAENTSNHDLFLRARSGDQEACESLLYRHRSQLQAWLRSRIGPGLCHKLDVEDVLQDTFSKAIVSLQTFEYRDEPSLFSWLCTIGERVILKAAKRDREKPLLTLRHEVKARRASPSKVMRRHERFDRLEGALDKLTPEYREVIVLARIEGLSIKEISRRMGRSPEATSMLLSRALVKLKSAFGDTESLSLPDRELRENRSGRNENE